MISRIKGIIKGFFRIYLTPRVIERKKLISLELRSVIDKLIEINKASSNIYIFSFYDIALEIAR